MSVKLQVVKEFLMSMELYIGKGRTYERYETRQEDALYTNGFTG